MNATPPHDGVTLHTMTAEEVQSALQRTHLDIIFAGQPKNLNCIQAAHGDPDSFVILFMPEAEEHERWQGVRMSGGSRTQRQQRYWGMLAAFNQQGIGKSHTPDGTPVDIIRV